MELKSVFDNHEQIYPKFTCDGKNINPPLDFFEVPPNAKSLALIMEDSDSPSKVWTHWLLWNIPANAKRILEGSIPKGAVEGLNDFGDVGYGGPCPHSGTHRYEFKLFALDCKLDLPEGASKADVETAIKGHIVDKTIFIGTYSRDNRENL